MPSDAGDAHRATGRRQRDGAGTALRRTLARLLRAVVRRVRRVLGTAAATARLAQLEATVAGLREQHDAQLAALRDEVAGLRTAVATVVEAVVPIADAGHHLVVRIPTGPDTAAWLTFGDRRDHYVLRSLARDGIAADDTATLATTLAVLEEVPGPFLDVGANVGVFSLVVQACLPGRRVVGFEPTPDLAATFRALVAANGQDVEVEELALGAEDGRTTLYLSAASDSSNSLRRGFRDAVGEVDVEVLRLDTWLERDGGPPPTVLKIDTESTEPEVLRGADHLVRQHRPWLVVEVLHNRTEAALTAWCEEHGYRAHQIVDDGPRAPDEIVGNGDYVHLNWLFAPGSLPPGFAAAFARWHHRVHRATTLDLRQRPAARG